MPDNTLWYSVVDVHNDWIYSCEIYLLGISWVWHWEKVVKKQQNSSVEVFGTQIYQCHINWVFVSSGAFCYSVKSNFFKMQYLSGLYSLINLLDSHYSDTLNSLFTVQHITSSSKGPRRPNLNEQSTIIQYNHSVCPHKTPHYQQSSFPSVPFPSEVNAAWLRWITVDNAPLSAKIVYNS